MKRILLLAGLLAAAACNDSPTDPSCPNFFGSSGNITLKITTSLGNSCFDRTFTGVIGSQVSCAFHSVAPEFSGTINSAGQITITISGREFAENSGIGCDLNGTGTVLQGGTMITGSISSACVCSDLKRPTSIGFTFTKS